MMCLAKVETQNLASHEGGCAIGQSDEIRD